MFQAMDRATWLNTEATGTGTYEAVIKNRRLNQWVKLLPRYSPV